MAEQDCHRGALQQAIITSLRARLRGDENRIRNLCLGVGFAKNKQSLLGYAFGNTRDFLQIYLAMPSLLPKVRYWKEREWQTYVGQARPDGRWHQSCCSGLASLVLAAMLAVVRFASCNLGREATDTALSCVCSLTNCSVNIVAKPALILSSQTKTLLADGIHVDGYGQLCASTSYESNVPFVLRFMVRPCAERKHVFCVEIRCRPVLC